LGTSSGRQVPMSVPEIRATKLTEERNKPPYHAGRFFLSDDVVPDPLRMICKVLAKDVFDSERANELATSFYDRYIPVSVRSRDELTSALVEAYEDFDASLSFSAIELYIALRDRGMFYELLTMTPKEEALVVVDLENNCVPRSLAWFTGEDVSHLSNVSVDSLVSFCSVRALPIFEITGRRSDYTKRGIWYRDNHCVAVVGLTEFKVKEENERARSYSEHQCKR